MPSSLRRYRLHVTTPKSVLLGKFRDRFGDDDCLDMRVLFELRLLDHTLDPHFDGRHLLGRITGGGQVVEILRQRRGNSDGQGPSLWVAGQ